MKKKPDAPACSKCINDQESIFRHLTPFQIEDIEQNKINSFYKRGEIIYHEGNRMSGCYCVNRGILKLYSVKSNDIHSSFYKYLGLKCLSIFFLIMVKKYIVSLV